MITAKDYDRALIAPDEVFKAPLDVVHAESLTFEQKMKVLKHWEANAQDLQVATEESMTGPTSSRLGEVKAAIIALEEELNVVNASGS